MPRPSASFVCGSPPVRARIIIASRTTSFAFQPGYVLYETRATPDGVRWCPQMRRMACLVDAGTQL